MRHHSLCCSPLSALARLRPIDECETLATQSPNQLLCLLLRLFNNIRPLLAHSKELDHQTSVLPGDVFRISSSIRHMLLTCF